MKSVVVSPSFYGEKKCRFDVIMIENDEDIASENVSNEGSIPVWFEMALCVLRVRKTTETNAQLKILSICFKCL